MSGMHDLVGPYVVDALGAEERLAFEGHLSGCHACRAEVSALRDAAASMVESIEPGESVRDAVMTAIRSTPQDRIGSGEVVELRQVSWPRRFGAVAAAMVIGVVAAVWAVSRPDAVDRVLAADDAVAIVLEGELPGETRVVVSEDEGRAVLVATGVPGSQPNQFYEVWVIDAAGPVSVGAFEAGDGSARLVLNAVPAAGEVLAVTVEPVDGTPQPEGPVVLSAEV